ncbi:MAG: hypothetical protein CL779_00740 [Chloroflexi bacterium]|nr:hypothetical protein [Chloroflexota bacterium]
MTSTPGSGSNPIDFPNPPVLDVPVTLENGASYVWDGEKWRSYVDPSSADNLWRNNGGTLISATNGRNIAVTNNDGDYKIELKSGGDITSTKDIYGRIIRVQQLQIRDNYGASDTVNASIALDGDAVFKDLELTGNFKIQTFPELPS